MPTLTIVIGGNGAGKTTWCGRHRRWLPERFYNADSIAEGFGGWDSPRAQHAARQLVGNLVRGHLASDDDFGFESTYSGNSRPGFVTEAKRLGYRTHAILIGTEDPAINAARVAARVASATGHHVPRPEIHRRWKAAQDNLVRTATAIDFVDLLDSTGPATRLITRIRGGRAADPATPTPAWAARLATRIEEACAGGLATTSKAPG